MRLLLSLVLIGGLAHAEPDGGVPYPQCTKSRIKEAFYSSCKGWGTEAAYCKCVADALNTDKVRKYILNDDCMLPLDVVGLILQNDSLKLRCGG